MSGLEKSVQDLTNVKVSKNGTGAVSSAVDKTKRNAQAVASSAQHDFPNETSAMTSAVDALSKSTRQLSSSPTAAIAALPGEIATARSAVKNFAHVTSSKCA